MSAIQDVVAAMRDLLEPDAADEDLDVTGAEPLVWEAPRTYVFPGPRLVEAAFETGPTARQDFDIDVVRTIDSSESANRKRDDEITAELDEWAARAFEVVRTNRVHLLWGFISAALRPPPRTLHTRSIAIRISGWRFAG